MEIRARKPTRSTGAAEAWECIQREEKFIFWLNKSNAIRAGGPSVVREASRLTRVLTRVNYFLSDGQIAIPVKP